MLECSSRGGAHCGHPPLGYTTGSSLFKSQEEQLQCPGDGNDLGSPWSKEDMGNQLLQTAGQPTWMGIVPLGWVTAAVDWTSSTFQVFWEKNEPNYSVESGQEMKCFLGKNQQKFQKSHPHPLGTVEEEHLHWLEPQLWATPLIPHPSSHPHTARNLSLGTPLG